MSDRLKTHTQGEILLLEVRLDCKQLAGRALGQDACLKDVSYASGTLVFNQGDPAEALFVVCAGVVKLVHVATGEAVSTVLLGPGDLFGQGVLLKCPQLAYAQVVQPARVLRLTPSVLDSLLSSSPTLARSLMAYMAQENAEMKARLWVANQGSVREALALSLWYLAQRFGHATPQGVQLELKLSCQLLAETVGHSRQATNAALRKLRHEGIVNSHYGRIIIKDLTGLRKVVALFYGGAPSTNFVS